jgi:hypothetical protein
MGMLSKTRLEAAHLAKQFARKFALQDTFETTSFEMKINFNRINFPLSIHLFRKMLDLQLFYNLLTHVNM